MKEATILPPTLERDSKFQYVAGDPAIDLVNTVDWTSRGPENDRLTDYRQLTRWAEGAGILSSSAAAAMRAKAASRPLEAEASYRNALKVRGVLSRLFRVIAAGEPPGNALVELNRWLSRALGRMRVIPEAGNRPRQHPLKLGWADQGDRLESVIWPVISSAAALIVSEEAPRIRVCGGADCGWMYVDRSRNHLRRWCQMETCGTREKSRRRYRRRTGRQVDGR
jgi:predicted RNA-binding Zn ribbon-like protein